MTQTIESVYQNGMFNPLALLSEEITEDEKVNLVVETETESEEVNPNMKPAENVYEGLSEEDKVERLTMFVNKSDSKVFHFCH